MVSREKKKKLSLRISSIRLPYIEMREQIVTYGFKNWHDEEVVVTFDGVLRYRWTQPLHEGVVEDDVAFEVTKSDWLSRVADEENLQKNDLRHLHHFQFCVYNYGVFDIICASMQVDP